VTLTDVLKDATRADAVVRDSAVLLEKEVSAKGGLRGAAIRAGFKTMKKIRPGIVPHALRVLLPQFAPVVDPHYVRAMASGNTVAHFRIHAHVIADDLLSVTDARARAADNRVLIRIYKTLRPQARKHVAMAMPGVAELCDKHVSTES
jgi:hypothetical protein